MSARMEGPAFDTSILMFGLRDTAGTRRALTSFESNAPDARGLGAVQAYVAENPGRRSLAPLVAPHSTTGAASALGFTLPEGDAAAGEVSTVHYVRLESPEDATDLRHALDGDQEAVEYCQHPVILYPQLPPSDASVAADDAISGKNRQWGLQLCGFPKVWEFLEQGEDPGPIAVIDMGHVEHVDIRKRVDVLAQPVNPSHASHAMEVSGVIGAERGDDDGAGMTGCCSARLALFNVWSDGDRFDSLGLYQAFIEVARSGFPVLNLSLGSPERDETLARLIRACVRAGVVVVAAAGDDAAGTDSPIFPAAEPDVIAVGGTEQFDNKTTTSKTGSHIWIAAPAHKIWTLSDNDTYEFQSGTSFAAPMVSAAAWLARRACPCLTPAQTRELLSRAVHAASAPAQRNDEVGFGRLDVVRLATLLGSPSQV